MNNWSQFPCKNAVKVTNKCNQNSKGKNVFIVSQNSKPFSGLYSVSSAKQNYFYLVQITKKMLKVVLNKENAKLMKEIIVCIFKFANLKSLLNKYNLLFISIYEYKVTKQKTFYWKCFQG